MHVGERRGLKVSTFKLDSPVPGWSRRRGNRESEDHSGDPVMRHGKALRMFLYGHALLGTGTIFLAIFNLQINKVLDEYANVFLTLLEENYIMLWNFLLYAPIISGSVVLLFAVLEIFMSRLTVAQSERLDMDSSWCKKKCGSTTKGVFRFGLVLMAVLFVLQAVFAVAFLVFLQAMFSSIEQMAVSSHPMSSLESEISTLQLAMFNLCCYEPGWSNQGRIPSCEEQDQLDTVSCSLPSRTEDFADVLCTCYTSNSYQSFYDALKETDICRILSDTVVSIDADDQIPGTGLPIKAFVPVDEARVVAFNGTAEDDRWTPSAPKGFGCGFGGYAKAFQWMQFKYTKQQSEGIAIVMILISFFEIVLILGLLCQLQAAADEEYFATIQNQIVAAHLADYKEQEETVVPVVPRRAAPPNPNSVPPSPPI